MKRIILWVLLIFLLICPKSQAKGGTKPSKDSSLVISQPTEKSFTTDKKFCFLNGKDNPGKILTIKIFSAPDLKGDKYDLLNLPKDDEWIEIYKEELTVGKLGIFDKQLDLAKGINKIVILIDGEEREVLFILVKPESIAMKELVPAQPIAIENIK